MEIIEVVDISWITYNGGCTWEISQQDHVGRIINAYSLIDNSILPSPSRRINLIAYPNEPSANEHEKTCIICENRSAKCVVLPCAHVYGCVTCMIQNSQITCAMCRGIIENTIRIYER